MYQALYRSIIPMVIADDQIFIVPDNERGINDDERGLQFSQVIAVNNGTLLNYRYSRRIEERWKGIVLSIYQNEEFRVVSNLNSCLLDNGLAIILENEISSLEVGDEEGITRALDGFAFLVIRRVQNGVLEIHLSERL